MREMEEAQEAEEKWRQKEEEEKWRQKEEEENQDTNKTPEIDNWLLVANFRYQLWWKSP